MFIGCPFCGKQPTDLKIYKLMGYPSETGWLYKAIITHSCDNVIITVKGVSTDPDEAKAKATNSWNSRF